MKITKIALIAICSLSVVMFDTSCHKSKGGGGNKSNNTEKTEEKDTSKNETKEDQKNPIVEIDYAPENLINAELKNVAGDIFYFFGNSARWSVAGQSYNGNGLYVKDTSTKNKARLKFSDLTFVMTQYPTYTYIKHSFDGTIVFTAEDRAIYTASHTTETKSSTGVKKQTANVSFSFTVKHD